MLDEDDECPLCNFTHKIHLSSTPLSSTMVKSPNKNSPGKAHSASPGKGVKHVLDIANTKKKIKLTAMKESSSDESVVAIVVTGTQTFHVKDKIKNICNKAGHTTHIGKEAFKPMLNLKFGWDADNRIWILLIDEEVHGDDDSRGKNFPKAGLKFFMKKLVNAITVHLSLEKEDVVLSHDKVVSADEAKYYKDFFKGGYGGDDDDDNQLEEVLAMSDPAMEDLF